MGGFEPPASPLPRVCSTPELHGLKTVTSNEGRVTSNDSFARINRKLSPVFLVPRPRDLRPFVNLERVMGIEPT